ncbi:MAG: CorA family divalent cation transporter [Limnospira sp.]
MNLPASWAIPESIRNRFGQKSAGKQRAMVADGHLLLVLHKAPQPGARDREAVLFWRRPDSRWECSRGGVAFQLLTNHFQDYGKVEAELSRQYAQARTAEDYFRLLEAIAPLQRAAGNLHATLQSAREAVPGDRDLIDFRDWAYEIERGLDLLVQNTKTALDFKMAKQAEEQAKLSFESVRAGNRLNLLAAIFFPLTAISCVFGMNIPSGLEGSSPFFFWFVFAIGILFGFSVKNWVQTGDLGVQLPLK